MLYVLIAALFFVLGALWQGRNKPEALVWSEPEVVPDQAYGAVVEFLTFEELKDIRRGRHLSSSPLLKPGPVSHAVPAATPYSSGPAVWGEPAALPEKEDLEALREATEAADPEEFISTAGEKS